MASARRINGSAVLERPRALEKKSQVVEISGNGRVFGTVPLLIDGERTAHQRFGIAHLVCGLEQDAQVVEVSGDVRVFGTVPLLIDGERTAHQRFGWTKTVCDLEEGEPGCRGLWRRQDAQGRTSFSSMASARRKSRSASLNLANFRKVNPRALASTGLSGRRAKAR